MLNSLRDYDKRIKNFIVKTYGLGHSLSEIESITGIKRNILITILDERGIDVKRIDLPSFQTDADKILVVADTHIGSKLENLAYIDEAYEFGVKEGVGACLHLGDIVQGMYDKTEYDLDEQMKVLEERYPSPSEFDTYLLMGNHDYSVFNENDEYMRVLESKKSLSVLGYKKAYFEWAKYLLSMEHKIKKLEVFIPEYESLLTLVGHGHELKLKTNNRVKAPTLSDDIMSKAKDQVPGFIIASRDDQGIIIDSYAFDEFNKTKVKKKEFYTKDYSDKYKVR